MKARLAAMEAEAAKLREVCFQCHRGSAVRDLFRHLTCKAPSAFSNLIITVQLPRACC